MSRAAGSLRPARFARTAYRLGSIHWARVAIALLWMACAWAWLEYPRRSEAGTPRAGLGSDGVGPAETPMLLLPAAVALVCWAARLAALPRLAASVAAERLRLEPGV